MGWVVGGVGVAGVPLSSYARINVCASRALSRVLTCARRALYRAYYRARLARARRARKAGRAKQEPVSVR